MTAEAIKLMLIVIPPLVFILGFYVGKIVELSSISRDFTLVRKY